MQQKQRLAIIFIPLGILLILVVIASALFGGGGEPTHAPQSALGNASSGEDVGPTVQSSFLGYDSLFDYGITTDQIDALQTAFKGYEPFSKTGTTIELVSGSVVSYAPDPHDPKFYPSIIASVRVNQKTIYRIKVYYWGISSVELILYDRTQQTKLFDSGNVQSSNAT